MVDIASLAIQIDTSDVARAENDLERLGTKGAKAEQAAKGVGDAYQQAAGKVGGVAGAASQAGTALERNSVAARENARELASVDRTASSLSGSMSKLGATLAGLTAGMSIKGIIDISDNYGQMADRIKMATASTEEYRMVQERLLQSANRTYRPLAEAQELYIRTADAIRSLGYQTSDALDITDSFSYLLVTNAASADKASNAIDAYSKSIQSGRIEVDSWQTLIAAMPSVVDTLSGSLGKSAEEIRQLGITGKLSLADLNEGLRQTVEQNQKLADGMGTTLNDAIVRASNNLSAYLGESSKVAASSRLLSGALDGVTENIDLIATTLGGVAVAAVARYATVTAKSTAASVAHSIAVKRQAAEELQLAQAQVASTAAAVAQARANVGLVGSMGQVTAALAAQEAAQKRLAAAQTASVGLGRTVLGLAGGWVGIALSAGAVAASFYDWSDSADEVQRSAIDLTGPLDTLIDKWKELGDAQRVTMGRQAEQDLKAATQTMAEEAAKVEAAFYKLGNVKGLPVESWLAPLREFREAAANGGQGINDFAQQLLDGVPAGSDFRRVVEDAAAAIEAQGGKAETLRAFLKTLEDQTRNNTQANGELAASSDATGKSFLDNLQRRADLSGKLTEVQKTQIAIEKGYAGALSETDKQAALAAAAIIDRTNALLNSGKSVDHQARAFKALYDSLYPAEAAQREYNEQIKLLRQYLSGDQLANAIKRLNYAIEGADATGPAEAIEEYRKQFERLHDELNPAEVAAREYAEQQKLLNDIIARGGEEAEKARGDLVKLREQYEANNREASQWAQLTEDAFERVSERGADMWEGFFESGKFSFDSLLDVARRWAAEMANALTIKPLLTSLGNAILGTNTQGGLADVWGGLLGGAGGSSGGRYGQGTLSNLSTAYSLYQAWQGEGLLGSLYQGFQSGGVSGAFGGAGSYFGNMLGGINQMLGQIYGTMTQGSSMTYAPLSYQLGSGTATSGGTNFLSGLSGMMTNWFTWALAGMIASGKAFDAGYRADASSMAQAGGSSTILQGAAWTQAGQSKFFEILDKGLTKLSFGLVNDKLAAIISGSSFHQMLWEGLIFGRLFGGGERYERQVGSATGTFSGGDYSGTGAVESWFNGERRFGDDFDSALHDLNEAFSSSLGRLFETFDIESEISTETVARLRRTSGKLLAGFTASFEDAVIEISGQYSKKADIQSGLQAFFDDVMGRGLAEAIAASSLPDYLKELVEGLTKADEVGGAISGLFQRFESVNATVEMLNLSAFELTDAGLRGADALLDLSAAIAGLENPTVVDQIASLGTLTSAYYENFFSEAERTQRALDAVARAFEQADVTLAGSRAEYRAMVEDIDLTTEAGRQMFATLMGLAGQASQYYSILERQMGASVQSAYGTLQRSVQIERDRLTREYQAALAQEQAAQAAAQSAAQARSAALNDMAATANANAQALRSLGNELDRALRGLIGATESGAQMLRRQAVETLEEALTLGRSGRSLASVEGLDKAVSSAAAVDKSIYSSLEDFEREQGRTANLIAQLNKINGKQLTTEEKLADDLRAAASAVQVSIGGVSSQLSAEYERAMAALDEELAAAQSQLDALNGIDRSVLTVAAAIAQMSAAVTAAMNNQAGVEVTPENQHNAMINQLYQTFLGSGADSEGIRHWSDRLAGGETYTDLIQALQLAAGAAAAPKPTASPKFSGPPASLEEMIVRMQLGVPAFASGGMHRGGLRLVGENGPELEVTGPSRIYNASQTAAMLAGGGDTAAAIGRLQQTVERHGDALRSIAKHTMQTARRVEYLERWDADGIPEERAIA